MKLLKSERGSITLISVFIIIVASGIFLVSFMKKFDGMNSLHKRKVQSVSLRPKMRKIAKLFRHAYDSGQMDNSCAQSGGGSPRVIDGNTFCFPASGKLCSDGFCAPTDTTSTNWRTSSAEPAIGNLPAPAQQSNDPLVTRNQIAVPNTTGTNSNFWRSCESPNTVCLRMLVCEEGANCTQQSARAMQILRIGELN